MLYGSGAQSLADGINKTMMEIWHTRDNMASYLEPEWYTKESAQALLDDYFRKFPTLKRWIDSVHKQIKDHGFIYSPFGRKRRLHNHKSSDRAVVSGELRSGLNAIPQGASSDHMLLSVMLANRKLKELKLDYKIIALVHDSVVVEVREDQVELVEKIIVESIQTNCGLGIEGVPVGVGADSEDGGSEDYSCGKLATYYPELVAL